MRSRTENADQNVQEDAGNGYALKGSLHGAEEQEALQRCMAPLMGENECERGGRRQRRARRAYGKIKETPGVEVASEHAGNEQGERELGRQGAHEGPQDEILVPERSALFQHLCKCVGACAVVRVRKTHNNKVVPENKETYNEDASDRGTESCGETGSDTARDELELVVIISCASILSIKKRSHLVQRSCEARRTEGSKEAGVQLERGRFSLRKASTNDGTDLNDGCCRSRVCE